jgi:hypothetical protein
LHEVIEGGVGTVEVLLAVALMPVSRRREALVVYLRELIQRVVALRVRISEIKNAVTQHGPRFVGLDHVQVHVVGEVTEFGSCTPSGSETGPPA